MTQSSKKSLERWLLGAAIAAPLLFVATQARLTATGGAWFSSAKSPAAPSSLAQLVRSTPAKFAMTPTAPLAGPDLDTDGTPDATDNCPRIYNPDQADENANSVGNACDSTYRYVAVAPSATGTGQAHFIYSGASVILGGVAGGAVNQFSWDFGDGTSTAFAAISNSYNLSATHTYTGVTDQTFTAVLTVRNSATPSTTFSANFPIVIKAKTAEIEANMAIEKGLWYLHTQLTRSTFAAGAPGYGQPNAQFSESHWSTVVAARAFAVQNHTAIGDPLVDPYVDDVVRLANNVLSQLSVVSIAAQTAGNPDVNGNGRALKDNVQNAPTYLQGPMVDFLMNLGWSDWTAATGDATYVKDRKLKDIVEDSLEYYWWGQQDSGGQRGGWFYTENSGSADNSTSKGAAIAALAATAKPAFGLSVPAFVKVENQFWTNVTQASAASGDGHFDYQNIASTSTACAIGTSWYNCVVDTASGMLQLTMQGVAASDNRMTKAVTFLGNQWGYAVGNAPDPNNSIGFYALYAVQKALRSAQPAVTTLVRSGVSFDWYTTEANFPSGKPLGVRRKLISLQAAAGNWSDTAGNAAMGSINATGMAVAMLSPGDVMTPSTATANTLNLVYDGTARAGTGVCVNSAAGSASAYSPGGVAPTNVGSYTFTWTCPGDSSHTASSATGSITISKAPTSTNVVFEPAPYVYRGTAFEAVATVSGGGLSQAATVTYSGDCTNVTSAGGCTASASYAGDANHNGSTGSASITITPAPSATTVTCSDATYTGAAQETCAAAVTGVGGLSTTTAVTYTNNVNAGTASASATYAGDANHDGSTGSATFNIAKATSSTVVTCSDATYTGAAQETCAAAVTGVGSLNTTATVTYTDNVNAGTASASATYAGDANHEGSTGSATFTIAKATSSTVVTCSDATFTGAAQETCAAAVTGAGGLSTTATLTYTDNVNAGTASGSATYAGDANHEGSTGSATFTIAKATSSTVVTCSDATYTGAAQETCTAAVTGAGGLSTTATLTYTDNVNAGTASGSATYAGDANHDGSTGSATFNIAKATSSTVVTCSNATFTGAAQETCAVAVTGAGGLSTTATLTYTDNVNAGTASGSATYAGDANHEGSTGSATFTIAKATSSTVVTCSDATYTGAAQETCTAAVTGAGGLSTTATLTYTDNVNAGTASASATYAGDANHEGSTGSATFTIAKATSSTVVTCSDATYTGAAQETCTAAVTGAGGLSTTATLTYTDNVNAGTASGSATYAGDANHEGSTGSATFTIAKATSSTVVTCSDATFTGAAQETCAAAVTGAGGLTTSATVTYTDNVNAGTASASATYAGDANHEGSTGSATFTIAKATSSTVVTCSDATYTGAAQETCTAAVTGAGGLSTTATLTYTDNVNAGTASASATYAGDANHDGSTGSATFNIAKATSATVVTCSDATYTGAAQETCAVAVTGAGGLSTTATLTYTDNVNAGTASASATYAGDANHDGSTGSATFNIAKATSSTVVTCSDATFTGAAQETCAAAVTGAGGLTTSATLTYTDNVSAGTASASATFAGDANHDGSTGSATFTIAKATSTTVIICTPSVAYSGAAQTVCTASVTGAGGLNQAVTPVTYTSNTNVGTASASATYAGDANHSGSTGGNTFAITPIALSVTANSVTQSHTAAYPVFTGVITGAVAGDNITATYSAGVPTNIPGAYAIVPAFVANPKLSNYAPVTKINGTLTLTNVAPVATPDAYMSQWNSPLTVAAPGVKSNDTDADGDAITATLVTTTVHGVLTFSATGGFTYMPNPNYSGIDTFTYRVSDAFGGTGNTVVVTLTITSPCRVDSDDRDRDRGGDDHDRRKNGHRDGDGCDRDRRNHASRDRDRDGDRDRDRGFDSDDCARGTAIAKDDKYSTKKNTTLTVTGTGVRGNDKNAVTVSLLSNPSSGTLALAANGTFVYTPAANFVGTVTFTYVARNSTGQVGPFATVTITVRGHWDGDGCDHDKGKKGHKEKDGCDHDKYQRDHKDDDKDRD